jgi:Putative restriction endonuclease
VDRAVFSHDGPWAEDAYVALRHDGRIEVVDGTLLVGPGVGEHRTRVIERVRAAVTAALPDGLQVVGPVPLRLGPDCVLVPDLVVTASDEDAGDAAEKPGEKPRQIPGEKPGEMLEAAATLLVVEVIGSDHGAVDRAFKPQLYARSRIPYSLLIDHDGPFAVAEMIISGRYHEYARAGGGAVLRIEEPFVLELDLDAMTALDEAPAPASEPAPQAVGAAEGPARAES